MSTAAAIQFPPRSGHAGSDCFQAIVAILRNRTGMDYNAAFNRVRESNGKLFERPGNISGDDHLTRLLNRSQARSSEATGKAIEEIAALTKRFAPPLTSAPTMDQWEALYGAALELERAGIPEKLFNRLGDEPVSKTDWKRANGVADDVLALLEAHATEPPDRGPLLENAQPCQIRGVFKGAVNRLMREENLTRAQAFERLKETEPIFWTLAMLTFEPDLPS